MQRRALRKKPMFRLFLQWLTVTCRVRNDAVFKTRQLGQAGPEITETPSSRKQKHGPFSSSSVGTLGISLCGVKRRCAVPSGRHVASRDVNG